jgi:hypothetical protein
MGNIMLKRESQSLRTILKYNIEFAIAGESRGAPSITCFCWIGALLFGLSVGSVPLQAGKPHSRLRTLHISFFISKSAESSQNIEY